MFSFFFSALLDWSISRCNISRSLISIYPIYRTTKRQWWHE